MSVHIHWGAWVLSSYRVWLVGGIALSMAYLIISLAHLKAWQQLLDGALMSVAVAMALARLEYVALHWHLFARDLPQVWHWNNAIGGLGWHGAIIGVGLVLRLHPTFRTLPQGTLAQAILPIFPIMLYCAWQACEPIGCLAGREVGSLADFPSGLVSEATNLYGRVVPRYNASLIGQGLAIALALGVGSRMLLNRPTSWVHVMGLSCALGLVGWGIGGWLENRLPLSPYLDLTIVILGIIGMGWSRYTEAKGAFRSVSIQS